jgi:hypothetical protein
VRVWPGVEQRSLMARQDYYVNLASKGLSPWNYLSLLCAFALNTDSSISVKKSLPRSPAQLSSANISAGLSTDRNGVLAPAAA